VCIGFCAHHCLPSRGNVIVKVVFYNSTS
jgi:hypothetical protein